MLKIITFSEVKCKSKPQRDFTLLQLEWLLPKRQKITRLVRLWRKGALASAGGNANWYVHYGKEHRGAAKN